MATIDNLDIQISASADGAIRSLDRLASSASRLRTSATSAGNGMRDMAQGAQDAGTATSNASNQAQTASGHVRAFGQSAVQAGTNAKKGTAGIASFWGALKRVAYYRMIRSIIKAITSAFKEGITNIYHYSNAINGHFAKSMDQLATSVLYLKNGLGSLVAPLMEALAPALEWLIDIIVDAINIFNQFIAVISGSKTYTAAKKYATTWDDAAKKTSNSVKELKKTILGFDEINKLVDNTNSSNSSGKKTANYGAMFEERNLSGGFVGLSNALEKVMSDTLSRITLLVSGATLAVGAILALTGMNVPLGLSLMAAGAVGLITVVGLNWEGLSADVKLAIGAIEAVVGGSLLAVGAVMAFSGVNVPLGIAMMAAGAISLAGAIGLNWDLITGKTKVSLKGVAMAVSGATLALGAILAFTGANVPLGVGLMVAGASGAAITLKWNTLKQKLEGPIGEITAIVSVAVLMLGMVAISAGRIPLGVGLLVAGSMGLAATVAARWDRLKSYLEGPIGVITGLVSAAVLMLGMVAIAAGRIPLGVGLLAAGSLGITAAVAARWDRLKGYLEGPIGDLTALISGAALVLGMVAIAAGRIPLGVGLLVTGAFGVAAVVAARWDRLQSYMEGPLGVLTEVLSGAMLALGFVAIAAGRIPLGVGLIVAGSAGIATNIAARWDRLKGYLEGPVGDLTSLLSGAMLVLGFAAIAAGRVPLGLGLMVAGSAGLATTIAARWNRLNEYMEGPLGTLVLALSGAFLVLGFAAVAAGCVPLGLGLIVAGAAGIAANLAARWNRLQSYMEGPLGTLTMLLSGALLVLGFTAIAAGCIPLGLGLIVMGAAGIATNLPARWDRLEGYLKGPIGVVTGLISDALLMLGMVAIVAGQIPLGLGLMVMGAVGLASTPPATWDILEQKLKGPIGAVTALISGATLVLGILALVAGNIPLGLGLILFGAAGLAKTIDANWGNMKQLGIDAIRKVKEGWETENFFEIRLQPKIASDSGGVKDKAVKWFNGQDISMLRNYLDAILDPGTCVDVKVDLIKDMWTTVSGWAMQSAGPGATSTVSLIKKWVGNAKDALGIDENSLKTSSWVDCATQWGYWGRSLANWIGLDDLTGSAWINCETQWGYWGKTLRDWLGLNNLDATATITTNYVTNGGGGGGGTVTKMTKARGGVYSNGAWHDIPQYARGGVTHGTLFWAGENGAEIVGNAGGRTEVLNASQLASVMYSSVKAAMSGVSYDVNFNYSGGEDDGYNIEELVEMTARQNELIREQNNLLRQINAKDYNLEISTASINKAQTRANRRAGTTLVPVGT